MLIRGGATQTGNSFAEDVSAGLGRPGQKELPSKYLYDDVGSALFEVITKLPQEYMGPVMESIGKLMQSSQIEDQEAFLDSVNEHLEVS